MSIDDFKNTFNIKGKSEEIDWSTVKTSIQEFASNNNITLENFTLPFSKNEYFALAEQKLSMGHWEMTNMLWENYNPNKLWYVIVGIGFVTIIALSIYDKMVIKPREKAELDA
jgi:hypothetical protein